MKLLLLTDVPPCTNYTAGMVLAQIVKLLPRGSVACFCILNPDLQNIDPDPDLEWMPLEYAAKPRETGYPAGVHLRELRSYFVERVRQATATPILLNLMADFAARQGVDTIWAVLQGQTMVRLAGRVADRLSMPLFTHVWDPLRWWLDAHGVDRRNGRAALAAFDATIRRSVAVATASPAMSTDFERRYHVRSVPLIACHDLNTSRTPCPQPHREGELVVGMAGQFYANAEWQTLVRALNRVNWAVAGREVRLLILGHYVPDSPIPKGRATFLGWHSQADTIRILAELADVLYCPYPFDRSMAEVAGLSFPSKLVSYFAAGRPVLLHAPVNSSPARYLFEREVGLVTLGSGESNVYNALYVLASDPGCYKALALGAQHAFASDFTLERMRERVFEFLDTDEAALANCLPAPVPFDPNSVAAQLPPPRVALPPMRQGMRAAVSLVRLTPLAAAANAAVRVARAHYRWRQRRLDDHRPPTALNTTIEHRSSERASAGYLDYLDLLKCYAVVLVLVVHVSAPGVYQWGAVPQREWWIAAAYGGFARTCVPLFLMASGATLLDLEKVEPVGRFLTRRARRILVPLLIWSAVYLADKAFLGSQVVTVAMVVKELLLGNTFYHMPFFYYLLGLYLCAPIFTRFTNQATPGAANYFGVLWLIVSCQLLASDLSGYAVGVTVPVVSGFAGYFVLGRLLREVSVGGRVAALCAAATLICSVVTVALTYWATRRAGVANQMFFEYGRPNVILMSAASFLTLSSAPVRSWLSGHPRVAIWTRNGASVCFGVFLIHPLLLQLVLPYLGLSWNSYGPVIGIVIGVIVLLALSVVAVWTLKQIPGVRLAVS